jgi:hypothetical protein
MLKGDQLKAELDMSCNLFYNVWDGHCLLEKGKQLKFGQDVEVGDRIPINCMFEMHRLLCNGERIGIVMTTQFHVKNEGGFIVAYLQNGAGKADKVEVLLKTDDLVIYHFPNRGTLMVDPHVGDEVLNIFLEQ